MSLHGPRAARDAPANVLFPEAYAATRKQIVKDFAFFGVAIVWTIVVAAVVGTAL